MYILSKAAINHIKDDVMLKAKIRVELRLSDFSIYRLYFNNDPNNDLTKYAIVEVISEASGLAINKILTKVVKDTGKKSGIPRKPVQS